ncbi:lysostaphin resistance A-like protein [Rhabdochlamydiaceae symbiont of Dictyostelium giganteum]|uniref:CPBP family intramembrane glutamic endopeptidase n=1 Tax=Rhabdochlamydiaceae symbiont of Dictyostelium giganteum TaxID=3342349 RepID=UPI00385056DD
MQDAIMGILSLSLIGLVFTLIASSLGFFDLPSLKRPPIELSQVASLFAMYLSFLFLSPLFLSFALSLIPSYPNISYQTVSILQFVITSSMLISLFLYTLSDRQGRFKTLLKHPCSDSSYLKDFGIGCLTWFMAFPFVAAINQLCDTALFPFFDGKPYEQAAVAYLKHNLETPLQAFFALTSIVIIAPVIEEFLFRGILQQYIKKFLSVRLSIVLTSFLFALFHFSSSQHLGNVSLISSLFCLSCFLGYLYEKQGSLYASIGLHMSFNLASSLQIMLFPEA